MTFWELVTAAATDHPDRVVVADDHGRSLTSVELRDAAERVAAGLGVGPGDVVSWQLPTVIESIVVLVALARVGAIQNPVIPVLRRREVSLITTAVGTTLLVVPEVWRGFEHAAMGREVGGFEVLALDLDGAVGPALRLPLGDPAGLPAPPTSGTDARWVYFSSGTTADPKGARHTDESLMASASAMEQHLGFGDGDVYPIAFPISHIGGNSMLAAALRSGGKLVLFDTFDPATTGERMAAHRPTILGSAVPFFRVYLDAQRRHGDEPLFPDLRTCTAGGAPTPPEIVHELVAAFGVRGVVQSWGLTEFPIATAARPDDPPEVLAETIGKPGPGVSLRVVDGELRLKGPQCFLGYLDPALDAHAFDEEGWFRTGDLGHVDADGNVRITGRLKDVIIRNAENISALEIEDVLLRHPGIADVAVIGVPDERTGERVVAIVVPEAGAEITMEVVASHCASEGLARHKTPEQLQLVEALPRNPMGKVLKQQLKDELGG
ncbi:MAG: fadK 2 [Actinomycetia bacterium]|nr:fadK 2 [Actinomycetes bacterium]